MKKSILKRLQVYMISFGIFMGIVFPIYANFFVIWKDGMFIYFVIGCMAAGVTVGVVSFLFVRVILIRKLLEVSNIADDISNRKLAKTIDFQSDDAVGVIINGLNSSIIGLRDLVVEIQNTCSITQSLLVKIRKGVGANIGINSIDKSIDIVGEATSAISEHSTEILDAVGKSKGSVTSWQEHLALTISNVKQLSEIMQSLVQNSDRINSIMLFIEGIASKTNLVSLNASIEATHAGAYGKSFSVVANEIRNLAGNVGTSANDISEYVAQIHRDIDNAESVLQTIEKMVSENCKSSNEVHDKLKTIESVSHSNRNADQQLVSSMDDLNRAFLSIDNVIEELSNNTENLQSIVHSYKF